MDFSSTNGSASTGFKPDFVSVLNFAFVAAALQQWQLLQNYYYHTRHLIITLQKGAFRMDGFTQTHKSIEDNYFRKMYVIYQQNDIFVSKLIETSYLVRHESKFVPISCYLNKQTLFFSNLSANSDRI